ncbi:DUF1211 domain-containing protein [Methanofollis aquaemaris]|uniref:DUF1211 domain-containing protein n=1 Tax=Methanofollis aquaemaris TaxID=126734 RepID=A0A8A3S597_9EURY|nr:TMEM175 family protein [Methanofollis aquaemaris]QSZ67437.1 DUF1211 domain-containing protein [Methanofollis aquaemaris]
MDRTQGTRIGFSKSRFEALTDGIFAIAMTLLVLSLGVPTVSRISTGAALEDALLGLFPDFIHYCIAFLILHGMWVSHHILTRMMEYIDRWFLDLNTILLMGVAVIPFSTAFSGDFPDAPIAAMILEGNLLVVGGLLLLQWIYVGKNEHLLRSEITKKDLSLGKRMITVIPALSTLGILLALAGSTWSTAIYLLIPPIFFWIRWRHRSSA